MTEPRSLPALQLGFLNFCWPAPSGVAVSPARPTRSIGRRRRCPCRSQA